MLITCPNCQTRYRVASDALSAAGRQVQCANCAGLWYATPGFPAPPAATDPDPSDDELAFRADRDVLFSPADEALLDAAFLQIEPQSAFPASEPPEPDAAPASPDLPAPEDDAPLSPQPFDAAGHSARTRALARRRRGMLAAMPLARFRRAMRVVIFTVLIGVVAAGLVLRTPIVAALPQMDGLYRLVGLGTNVIGLDFVDVKTLRTTRDGNSVIIVNAKISNITNRLAFVPSVLVSLLDADDEVLYEWTVNPATRNILPGDVLAVDAQLTGPPQGATTVRLSFVEGRRERNR